MLRNSIFILLIAVGGISAVFTGKNPLLGAKKCTWGPGYWCKNISTSHECSAIDHCVSKEWNSLKLSKDVSPFCNTCMSDLTHLETIVNSNTTLMVVDAFVEEACAKLVPAKLCETYLEPYVVEIQKALANHIDPQVICHVIHFCNNEEGVENTFLKQAQVSRLPTPQISAVQDSTASPMLPNVLNYGKVALDSVQCHQGQTFWCSNITTAASCKAVRHCIQSVWSHMKVDQDKDDVCTICKDMVKQARDQLLSNETQSDLKAVFEGSCNLIPVKAVREGCDRLVDDFVPELVEILSSQMNPDIVCSVAGLCNNVEIDRLLAAATTTKKDTTTSLSATDGCENCVHLADKLKSKFDAASKRDVIQGMHQFCSEFSSLSDACSKLVNSQAEKWYNNLALYFNTDMLISQHFPFSIVTMCHDKNLCTGNDSTGTTSGISVELKPNSESGVVSREDVRKDDLPCDLCTQLVVHLRDILIANTTNAEFHEILEGICKQTGSFSEECLDLVKNYYSIIYQFLTTELNPKLVCSQIGICPKNRAVVFNNIDILQSMVVPMSMEPVQKFPSLPSHPNIQDEDFDSEMVDKVVPQKPKTVEPVSPGAMIESATRPACMFCEYLLHFVQEQAADKKNEKAIMSVMDKACHEMPGEFDKECEQFVQEYGQAFIALFIQQIDPSQICPKLKVCSLTATAPLNFSSKGSSKGACPMCLLAVQSIEDSVLNNRTEENIRHSLEHVCTALPKHLASDCDRFVNIYYDELIDMIVAETSPQEICVFIRLCLPPKKEILPADAPSFSSSSSSEAAKDSQTCILCEFVMTNVDKLLNDNKTEEEIKHAVHSVCRIMPKNVKQECYDFVSQYADLVIQLLAQNMDPKTVCEALGVCKTNNKVIKVPVEPKTKIPPTLPVCKLCELVMKELDKRIVNNKSEEEIARALEHVCHALPGHMRKECAQFVDKHGHQIAELILENLGAKAVCAALGVCLEIEEKVNQCAVCKDAMSHLDDALVDSDVHSEIKAALDKVCYHVEKKEFSDCNKFILKYGTKILTIIDSTPSYLICAKIKVCPTSDSSLTHLAAEEEGDLATDVPLNNEEVEAIYEEPLLMHKLTTFHFQTTNEEEEEEMCSVKWGITFCKSQMLLICVGLVCCSLMLVIVSMAYVMSRNRLRRGGSGASTPYEKLYQPTTVPRNGGDEFTAHIVS